MPAKISIRFFDDRPVRAVWEESLCQWLFSVVDVMAVLNQQDDYTKNRNYWKYLKLKLKAQSGGELVSDTNQLTAAQRLNNGVIIYQRKIQAPDGKNRKADMATMESIIALAKHFPAARANRFIAWLIQSEESIDGQSKRKAYALFESELLSQIEVGTTKGLQQIHAYLFGGLYDFAGQIRTVNIAKGGFQFAMAQFLGQTLQTIDQLPEDSVSHIIDKYVEMNIAHPFREGNGRATRVWLDQMLITRFGVCVDWSQVDKWAYLEAMRQSVSDDSILKNLLVPALTDRIDDREVFMKGIDYSYYYEE